MITRQFHVCWLLVVFLGPSFSRFSCFYMLLSLFVNILHGYLVSVRVSKLEHRVYVLNILLLTGYHPRLKTLVLSHRDLRPPTAHLDGYLFLTIFALLADYSYFSNVGIISDILSWRINLILINFFSCFSKSQIFQVISDYV